MRSPISTQPVNSSYSQIRLDLHPLETATVTGSGQPTALRVQVPEFGGDAELTFFTPERIVADRFIMPTASTSTSAATPQPIPTKNTTSHRLVTLPEGSLVVWLLQRWQPWVAASLAGVRTSTEMRSKTNGYIVVRTPSPGNQNGPLHREGGSRCSRGPMMIHTEDIKRIPSLPIPELNARYAYLWRDVPVSAFLPKFEQSPQLNRNAAPVIHQYSEHQIPKQMCARHGRFSCGDLFINSLLCSVGQRSFENNNNE